MAKVLLVEDDNNLREIYQARLAAEGYEISSAQDGEEALVVAKQEKPDLVISDVMMPKISGFEMLDILRNTAGLEHVKVIMLTALGQSEDRDRADSLGADKYLVKSQVTLEDIVKTAHQLLDGDGAGSDTAGAAAAPLATDDSAVPAAADPVAQPPADDAATTPPVDPPAVDSPAPDAANGPDPTTAPADNGTAAQEAAVVQEQINSFVDSVPAEPAVAAPAEAPTSDTTATATLPVEQAPPVTPEPTAEAPVQPAPAPTGDDQLMANAASELASSATDAGDSPEPTAEAPVQPAPAEPPAVTPENPNISTTTISGKKVIEPLDSEPKPDIHELLAKEEAASGVTGPVVTSAGAASDIPAPQASPGESVTPASSDPLPAPEEKKPDGGFDPNSVAL